MLFQEYCPLGCQASEVMKTKNIKNIEIKTKNIKNIEIKQIWFGFFMHDFELLILAEPWLCEVGLCCWRIVVKITYMKRGLVKAP